MKKILTTLSIAALLALGIGGLAACSDDTSQYGFNGLTTDTEILGFSAASAGMIISSMEQTDTSDTKTVALSKNSALAAGTATAVTDEETIDELNNYMTLVENLLENGGYEFTESTSDDANYQVKLTISCSTISDSVNYVMYYNSTLVNETTQQKIGETETEQIYQVEGILLIGENIYPLSGTKQTSTETEGWETKTETEHNLTITLSETSRMIVKQEMSEEDGETEQEYTYSIYENNVLTESCSFSYEQERDETEIEMIYKLRSTDGTLNTQVFFFEKETEYGKEVIKIKVGSNSATATYTVSIDTDENGNTYYTYTTGGYSYIKTRG